MTQLITRCPACGTSFRITEAQLKTAKGQVRCGSCLKIFKAMDNLAGGGAAKKPAAAPQAKAAPAQTKKPTAEAALPKFEYKRPTAGKPAKGPATPRSRLPGDDDDYGEVDTFNKPQRSFTDDEGQANMLRFDQNAIDSDDTDLHFEESDDFLVGDNPLIGDDVRGKKSAYGDDLAESFIDLDSWQPQEKSLFDRKNKPPKDEDDENKHDPDESWAIELLEESDEEEITLDLKPKAPQPAAKPAAKAAPAPSKPAPKAVPQKPAEELELSLEMQEPDLLSDDGDADYSRATTGSFDAVDDSDIEDALGEPLSERSEPRLDASEDLDLDEEYAAADYEYEDDYDDEDSFYADPEDRGALLSGIEPEPVEFGFRGRRVNWRSHLVWGSLAVVGLLLLVAQVAWLQYDALSRKPPYRGWYELVGVDVPPIAAPNLIRASNLVVRSHPEAENALMVDTILLNTAGFSQPYPDLVLAFSNIQGQTLAARRFSPQEYLAGELAGSTEMPSNQPVHLSLEIVDPGPEAVNYTAYIPNN